MERKTVLVTGASRGIGRAIAISMAKEGFNVIVNYNGNQNKAQETLEECKKYGVEVMLVQADVSKYEEVEKMIQNIVEKFERIDVLVNNAGIVKDSLLLRMSEDDFDKVIDVNLKGCFNCIKHVSKLMMKQRSGSIINISSVIGLVGNVGQINYAASKAGILGLTKASAKELASRNIRVNAIAPGFIDTEMSATLNEKIKANILDQIALKRFGRVEDVANVAVFLASEKSNYISGQCICVDGGMVM